MARRTTYTSPISAILSKEAIAQAIPRLKKRLEQVKSFDVNTINDKHHNPDLHRLESSIDDALTRTYGQDTVEYKRYCRAARINLGALYMAGHDPDRVSDIRENARKSLADSEALLAEAILSLEERSSEMDADAGSNIAAMPNRDTSKVFIVHGHDAEAKEAVARFLGQLNITPIILHEQASRGQTIIEKIESNSDVGFAIVLLTPDDEGGKSSESLQPRPRQNVLLELGYFIGKLGRAYVCALRRGPMELPSDFLGIVFEEFDPAGAWKIALGKELTAAGFKFDWNIIMGSTSQ